MHISSTHVFASYYVTGLFLFLGTIKAAACCIYLHCPKKDVCQKYVLHVWNKIGHRVGTLLVVIIIIIIITAGKIAFL